MLNFWFLENIGLGLENANPGNADTVEICFFLRWSFFAMVKAIHYYVGESKETSSLDMGSETMRRQLCYKVDKAEADFIKNVYAI